MRFEWDPVKSKLNRKKHGVYFELAQRAFFDPNRVVAKDLAHSAKEKRYFCFGKIGGGILTVRFTYRDEANRIIGAGYWRKGKVAYEKANKIQR